MNLNFAENFKRLRKEKGITQEKIADILGVSSQSVSRWELCICYPDIEMLPSIANYFGVTVDHLLSNDILSKERDSKLFLEKLDQLSSSTTETIDFVNEYCKKYPEDDCYAFQLICAIKDYAFGNKSRAEECMPLLLKNVQRLLETQYRYETIRIMIALCAEDELEKWLDMTPYKSDFSRRACLVERAYNCKSANPSYIQQGLERFETFAAQLDSRCPDSFGARRKAKHQESVLKVVRSFGGDAVPDGWKFFYAYKELVLSACLFGCKETEKGWQHFDSAIETCKDALSITDEWLDIGGEFFSNLKVNKIWNYAIDEDGNKHKLFAVVNYAFSDMDFIYDLLTNSRWAWFDSVRENPKFQSAVAWAKEAYHQLNEEE